MSTIHWSSLFWRLLATRPVDALGRRMAGPFVPVFLLHRSEQPEHRISGVQPAYLRRCLDWLARHRYRHLALAQLAETLRNGEPLPQRAVVFCMDDGYADQAQVLAPLFLEYDSPVTCFLITDLLDRRDWPWDDKVAWLINHTGVSRISLEVGGEALLYRLEKPEHRREARHDVWDRLKALPAAEVPEVLERLARACHLALPDAAPAGYEPMAWDQARALAARGVQFGPHSRSHRILSRLGAEDSEQEIIHSWQRLREELPAPAPVFCYPTGRAEDFGPREQATVERLGLRAAACAIPAPLRLQAHRPPPLYAIPRMDLPRDFGTFVRYCAWMEAFRDRFR